MPEGDIPKSFNFELRVQKPLDAKVSALTLVERDAIPLINRYDMMLVSVEEDHNEYQLKLGTVDSDLENNLNWVKIPSEIDLQAELDTKLNLDQSSPQTISGGQPIQNSLTASELVSTDVNKKLQSLPVATYPSLIELSYVKGVTATIQTQLNSKTGHPSQIVTVGKSGCDYTIIQDAIDSITDATTIKRYCIYIYSGVYNENVVCKDYIDIVGSGRTNTIIAAISGTVLIFSSTKCTVSELGIVVDYGTLTVNSSAIVSSGLDSVLKDCDITVTKTAGDYLMHAIEIAAGSFRMSDCYINYFNNTAIAGTYLIQSAILQSGTLTDVIMNNNEINVSTINPNNDIVGFETTANVTGSCILSNNLINLDADGYAVSATGLWLYGTGTSAIFIQNRIVIDCDASAYGFWIDSTAGGAVIESRHNVMILTSVGASVGCNIATGDIWNSTFDKLTAKTTYSGAGTVHFVSSYSDGDFKVTGITLAPNINGFSTQATATGITTLTVSSNYKQIFTGSTTQTVVMPDVTTLVLGRSFEITNKSTGIITVNSSGSNLITTIPAGQTIKIECILITGTDASSWNVVYLFDKTYFDNYYTLLLKPRRAVTTTASLVSTDNTGVVEMNSTSDFNFTIDQMSDGFQCDLININTGDITLVAGSGVTLYYENANRKLATQWKGVSIYFRSATECVIVGFLEA